MTYEEYKLTINNFNQLLDDLHNKLNSFPKDGMGLISDEFKQTIEYKETKNQWNITFRQFREFNSLTESKRFSKMLLTEKRNKIKK